MKCGILLAVFGSNTIQGRATLSFFEEQVQRQFPGIPIRWAFTSRNVKHQFDCEGNKFESVKDSLIRMTFEQFTHVALQPLHIISGIEYSEIVSTVHTLKREPNFPIVLIGKPILTENKEDVLRAVEAIFTCIPKERTIEEPVLFMGHGSRRLPQDKYMDLANSVAAQDPLVFIGTMNGVYRLEHILPTLKHSKNQIWLLPLFTLVGNHVLEDMAGVQKDSWKSRIEDNGFLCIPILKGMIEYYAFIEIWVDHLSHVLDILYTSSCLGTKDYI